MENASKALIIAGAILLAIIIISLGIMVVNNARNQVGSANLSKTEMEAFNAQWENYQGSNKTASEVRSLYSSVIAHNASEDKLGTGRQITIALGNDTAGKPTQIPRTIVNNNVYTITPSYAHGIINSFTVKPTTNTTNTTN